MKLSKEDIVVEHPPKGVVRNYTESDMKVVYDNAGPRSWADAIRWLNRHAVAENKLSMEKALGIKEDLVRLHEAGEPFSGDYRDAYKMAVSNRAE